MSFYQAVGACRVVRRRGFHIFLEDRLRYNYHTSGHYSSSFKNTTFLTLDSVTFFRWNLLENAQQEEPIIFMI
jgi:hypothetical protein